MEFVSIQTDITTEKRITFLEKKYKDAGKVWIYLLIEFGKEKNEINGFMIFANEKWYKDFSKICRVSLTTLKEIIKRFSDPDIQLISTLLFNENILFSEKFLLNHRGFWKNNRKNFSKIYLKIQENLDFLFKTRESNSNFSMKYEDFAHAFAEVMLRKKLAYSNMYSNMYNIPKGIGADAPANGFELTPIEMSKEKYDYAKELSNIVDEANNLKQFEVDSWQYVESIKIDKAIKKADPNSPKQNYQEGARILDELNSKNNYTVDQIKSVVKYFEVEKNKSSPYWVCNRIINYSSFKQYFRNMSGVKNGKSGSGIEDKLRQLTELTK